MLHDKETGIYKLRHVRLYLYLWNLFVQGLWTEEMQDYAKHNTQIDVIYNSLEQLYSAQKGKKNSAREADWGRVWGGERRWSLETLSYPFEVNLKGKNANQCFSRDAQYFQLHNNSKLQTSLLRLRIVFAASALQFGFLATDPCFFHEIYHWIHSALRQIHGELTINPLLSPHGAYLFQTHLGGGLIWEGRA